MNDLQQLPHGAVRSTTSLLKLSTLNTMTTGYNPEYDQPASQLHNSFDEEEARELREVGTNDTTSSSFTSSSDPLITTQDSDSMKRSASASISPLRPQSKNKNDANNNNKTLHISMSSQTLNKMSADSPARILTGRKREKYNSSAVERIIRITPTCFLKPKCFFVAWNSVIVLVFTGWPEPIDTMKSELSSSCTLCQEYFGSKFPKITLGCVKDGVVMTPKLLAKVRKLCAQNQPPSDSVFCIDALSVVLWENRSQESIIYEKIIPLKKNHVRLHTLRLFDNSDSYDA